MNICCSVYLSLCMKSISSYYYYWTFSVNSKQSRKTLLDIIDLELTSLAKVFYTLYKKQNIENNNISLCYSLNSLEALQYFD